MATTTVTVSDVMTARRAATIEAIDALPQVADAHAAYCATVDGSQDEATTWAAYDAISDAELAAAEAEVERLTALYLAAPSWVLVDGDSGVTEDVTGDLDAARERAEEWAREGDWDTSDGTIWVDVDIYDALVWALGREERARVRPEETVTVQIDQDEPACTESEHDWQDDGTPGFGSVVRGHGGGVICAERCSHCGCRRVTDTWAQRPDTGEQGLTSVSYEAA